MIPTMSAVFPFSVLAAALYAVVAGGLGLTVGSILGRLTRSVRRFALPEALTALAFAALFVFLSQHPERLGELLPLLYLTGLTIAIARTSRTLPNTLVMPAYPVTFVLLAVASILTPERGLPALLTALAGAAILVNLTLVLGLAVPRSLGFGYVKLAGVLGLYLGWLGWSELLAGAATALLAGGCWAACLMLTRRPGRSGVISFTPWMLAGAWTGILFGDPVAAFYLTSVGLG
ncbi:MAG: prepilin peptidase [Glaciihabitans sp.]|nr:prepilin peptidase [Glaciihabitans sp.]